MERFRCWLVNLKGKEGRKEGSLKWYTVWESHVRRGGMRGMEGTSWANHPLRAALISNYLIKICLRRGAPYAPFDVFFYLLARPPKPEEKKRGRGFLKGRRSGRTDSPTCIRIRNLGQVRAEFVIYHCSNYNHSPCKQSTIERL